MRKLTDLIIDINDVADFTLEWLFSAEPNASGICEMPRANLNDDCNVNMTDFALFAQSLTLPPKIIYQNDFGTLDQRTVGGTGDWDIDDSTTPNLLWYESGYGDYSLDLDGDGLHGGIMQDGLGQISWTRQITAPAGKTLENIRVLAHGHGWKNYVGLELRLSPGGTADYSKTAQGDAFRMLDGTAPEDNPITVNASGDPAYTGISSFYLTVIIDDTGVHPDYRRAYLSDVTVYADVD